MAKASIKLHGGGACPYAPQAGRAVAPRPPQLVRLGDVCEIERGGSPRPIEDYITTASDGINWIKIGDADDSMFITSTAQKIRPEGVKKSRMVYAGDFLLSNSMSFGRPYILKIDGCIHDGWLVIHDKDNVFHKPFLYYYLSAPSTYQKFKSLAVGGVVNNLNSKMVRGIEVPLPPIPEQKRIAAILNKICEMKRNAEARLQKLDLLVKARFVEMFGDPVATVSSESKNLVQLGDVASLKAGKFISAKEISNDGEYPCYGGNGVRGWVHDFNQDGEFPLIGRQGALCGNVQLARGRFYATEHAVVVKPILRWNSVYMYYLLKALKLGRFATGAAQPGLSVSKLEELIIDIPPLALQRQFAAFVEKVEGLKATAKKELEQVDLLYRAKLQEFFG